MTHTCPSKRTNAMRISSRSRRSNPRSSRQYQFGFGIAMIRATSRPPEILHQSLAGRVYDLLMSGAYDTAVFEAFLAVEVTVRQASDLTAEDVGVWLMRRAFDKRHGSLTDARVPEAEREATAHLFAGAIGLF